MSDTLAMRFLTDGGQTVEAIADDLAALIDSARHEVAIAIYDFHVKPGPGEAVAKALQAASARGVSVRLCDHDELRSPRVEPVPVPPAPPEYVDSLGLDVRPVHGRGTLMHHKYVVVDRARIWTGSLNWTDDSFTRQENCVLTLTSAELAADYLRDFEQLWASGKVEDSGGFDCSWHPLTMGGQPISTRAFFCPGRGPELAADIAASVRTARKRILICSPVLTSGPILGALSDVVAKGHVPVRGVVDGTQMDSVKRQWRDLPQAAWKWDAFAYVAGTCAFGRKNSVPWSPTSLHDFLHAKAVVCDDRAYVGSYNHSRSGEENAENVLALDGSAAADRVAAFIEQVAARYARPAGDQTGW